MQPTTEKLAAALRAANAPQAMISKAEAGYYDDFKSPIAMPLHQLVSDAQAAGLPDIAMSVINGDFDATREESAAWAASEDGKRTMAMFMPRQPGAAKRTKHNRNQRKRHK